MNVDILFKNLSYEEEATYYNHCVYRLPKDFDLESCTHILQSYDGGEELDEISIGIVAKNAVGKLRYIRKKYVHYDSFIYTTDCPESIAGVTFNAETKLTDMNSLT